MEPIVRLLGTDQLNAQVVLYGDIGRLARNRTNHWDRVNREP